MLCAQLKIKGSQKETLSELIPILPLISKDTFWKFIITPKTISETTYSNLADWSKVFYYLATMTPYDDGSLPYTNKYFTWPKIQYMKSGNILEVLGFLPFLGFSYWPPRGLVS